MTQLVLEIEELNGKFTVMIGTQTPAGATANLLEKAMANHLMTRISEQMEGLMGLKLSSTVEANTGNGALNHEIVDAARAKFLREQG